MSSTPQTTPAALQRARTQWPDRPAVRDHQWGEAVDLTWSDVADRVATFAGALVDLGVEPGDRVAVWAPNSYHWPIAARGRQYAGALLVPLNTRYTVI